MFSASSKIDSFVFFYSQVSSGLYHNALVTNLSQLYTWGRNLEKQLGRENTRCDLQKPTHLEQNDNVVYVECGADFTLILTDQYAVKAFGNNNAGQVMKTFFQMNDRKFKFYFEF